MPLNTTLTKERQKCNLINEQQNKECERTRGLILKERKRVSYILSVLQDFISFTFLVKLSVNCRTVGPSLAASLEPLAHHRFVASLKFFL